MVGYFCGKWAVNVSGLLIFYISNLHAGQDSFSFSIKTVWIKRLLHFFCFVSWAVVIMSVFCFFELTHLALSFLVYRGHVGPQEGLLPSLALKIPLKKWGVMLCTEKCDKLRHCVNTVDKKNFSFLKWLTFVLTFPLTAIVFLNSRIGETLKKNTKPSITRS